MCTNKNTARAIRALVSKRLLLSTIKYGLQKGRRLRTIRRIIIIIQRINIYYAAENFRKFPPAKAILRIGITRTEFTVLYIHVRVGVCLLLFNRYLDNSRLSRIKTRCAQFFWTRNGSWPRRGNKAFGHIGLYGHRTESAKRVHKR